MPTTTPNGLPIPQDTDNLADGAAAIRNLANALDTAWTAVTFLNSWVNFAGGFQAVQYRKVMGDRVQIRGLAKSGTVGVAMFNLPVGFRPASTQMFPANTNDTLGRLHVGSDGNVLLAVGSNAWVTLNVEFHTA